MPRRKKKAHEMTTDEALRKMFPKRVRDEATQEAKKASGSGKCSSTTKKPS